MMHPTIRITRDTGSSGAANGILAGTRKTTRIKDKARDKDKGKTGMEAADNTGPTVRTAVAASDVGQHSWVRWTIATATRMGCRARAIASAMGLLQWPIWSR